MQYVHPILPDGSVTAAKLADGAVITPKLKRRTVDASNAGIVTVTAGGVTVCQVDLGSVAVGDIINFRYNISMTKGATGGRTTFFMTKVSGTGDVRITFSTRGVVFDQDVPANAVWGIAGDAECEVTVAGTLVLSLFASSSGSDSSIVATGARIRAVVHEAS